MGRWCAGSRRGRGANKAKSDVSRQSTGWTSFEYYTRPGELELAIRLPGRIWGYRRASLINGGFAASLTTGVAAVCSTAAAGLAWSGLLPWAAADNGRAGCQVAGLPSTAGASASSPGLASPSPSASAVRTCKSGRPAALRRIGFGRLASAAPCRVMQQVDGPDLKSPSPHRPLTVHGASRSHSATRRMN